MDISATKSEIQAQENKKPAVIINSRAIEGSRTVPVTMRDYFFHDPYFEHHWPAYDHIHQDLLSDSQHLCTTGAGSAAEKSTHRAGRIFPRRWMFPRYLSKEESDKLFPMDIFHFHLENEDLVHVTDDEVKLEVSLDTHGYKPDEIKVHVEGNMLILEAKHEEEDDNKYVTRQFSRQYELAEGSEADMVHSSLSSDGILVVTAPKVDGDWVMPIEI